MRQYVFVTGIDYVHIDSGPTDFRAYADRRMRWLAKQHPRKKLKFHIFDFWRGVIATRQTGKGTTVKNKDPDDTSHKKIAKGDYKVPDDGPPYFDARDKNTLSIVDVYDKIEAIGKNDAGSLAEVSFFSHGYWEGPILVNSYKDTVFQSGRPEGDTYELPETFRDPDDKDPRPAADFSTLTTNKKQMQAAFASDGYIWIWGCSFPKQLHKLLHDLESDGDFSVRDTDADAKIELRPSQYKELFDNLKGFFSVSGSVSGRVEVRFDRLKFALCRLNKSTYAAQFAQAADTTVYAAAVGTYAVYDDESENPQLLHVERSFGERVRFYRNHLPLTDGPEDRGYVGYPPDLACSRPASMSGSRSGSSGSGSSSSGSGSGSGSGSSSP
ncbi:hypothetical protein [Haloferax sp. Atlit-48N]|uniref:Uncharacterized protein n=1 Tax=Haloferax sp. Atlit-48N TaxID=2077198 RepID=A0ACD5I626_9EURY|nr:hypothetical protein [Haloferax sp. Atlit-48N]